MEKNRISVKICGIEYILVSTEAPEYVHKVAYMVDKKMNEILESNTKLSTAQAAVLTAVNLADERIKSSEGSDNLRDQVAEYSRLSEEYKLKYLETERKYEEAKKHIEQLEKRKKTSKARTEAPHTESLYDYDDEP